MTAEYLVDPAMHQLDYVFCFSDIVEDLKKQKEILALTLQCLQNYVERARRNAEEIEDDVDANRILADVQSLENEIEECKKCSNQCPSEGCRFRLIRKLKKRTLSLMEQQKTCKFEQVGHLTSLPRIVFFPFGDFISSKSSTFVLNQIMVALEDDDASIIGVHGVGGVGKTILVKEVRKKSKN